MDQQLSAGQLSPSKLPPTSIFQPVFPEQQILQTFRAPATRPPRMSKTVQITSPGQLSQLLKTSKFVVVDCTYTLHLAARALYFYPAVSRSSESEALRTWRNRSHHAEFKHGPGVSCDSVFWGHFLECLRDLVCLFVARHTLCLTCPRVYIANKP